MWVKWRQYYHVHSNKMRSVDPTHPTFSVNKNVIVSLTLWNWTRVQWKITPTQLGRTTLFILNTWKNDITCLIISLIFQALKQQLGKKIKSNINQFINRISRKLISSELTHHISSFRLKSSFLKCWWATSLRGSGDQNLCFFMSLCFYLIAIIHCRLTFSSFGKLGPQDLSTRHKATKLQCDIHTLHCKLLTLEVKFNIYE